MAHSLADFKYYLYRSKTKIESLYEQLPGSAGTVTVNLKVISFSKTLGNTNEVTLQDKLTAVLKELEERELVGLIEEGKPYIKGIFPFRWGMYNDKGFRPETDGPLVYFGGVLGDTAIRMGGSSVHMEGCYGLTSTGSRSLTSVLARWMRSGLETDGPPNRTFDINGIPEGIAVANHYLRGPVQQLEFVAKVLHREKLSRISHMNDHYGESILATPLFVSQVDLMIEDGVELPPHEE